MAYANLASATKLHRTQQIIADIGSGGFMELWTSLAPGSPDLAPTGVMLARLPLSATAGVASLAVLAGLITAAGTGGTNGSYALTITPVGAGSGAHGSYSVSGGIMTAIYIDDIGNGYTVAPTLSGFTNAGLTGATATAIMTATLVFNPILTATAVATGRAGWARITNSSHIGILDLDVGTTNASSVVMTNSYVITGSAVSCSAEVLIEA